MATQWKRTDKNGKTYYEGVGPDGKIMNVELKSKTWHGTGDGLKHNNFLGATRGSQKQFDDLLNHFFTTGNMPTPELLGLTKDDQAWKNLEKDFKGVLKYNDIDEVDYQEKLYAANPNNPEIHNPNAGNDINAMENLFGFDTPGTVGNTLYDTYRQANQDQFKSSMQESQYMEKDLNRMVGQERQSLIDSIREDRKKMLKSGLSQSAIANREIQGLLQGQSIATELGTEFLGERRNLMQMGNTIDSMSKTQALDSMNAGIGNTFAGITAAQAGSQYETSAQYNKASPKLQAIYDELRKSQ